MSSDSPSIPLVNTSNAHHPMYHPIMEDYKSIEDPDSISYNARLLTTEHEEDGVTQTISTSTYSVRFAWFLLFVAITFEVAGTTAMKLSNGLTRLLPSIMIYILYGMAFSVFPLSLKRLELSTAYAVWSGVGTTVTAIIGFVWFHDTINWTKIFALVAIVGGCVVLQFADENDPKK